MRALVPAAVGLAALTVSASAQTPMRTVDFRYAPSWWQTSICLPDDWQKTLVGKEGMLLYDYPGRYSGFATRITAALDGATWVRQELLSPRLPVVRTLQRAGDVEVEQLAFASPITGPVTRNSPDRPHFERLGAPAVSLAWAQPVEPADPAFRDIAVGWNEPLRYRIPVRKGQTYTVALGVCEGFHTKPGERLLALQIEGKTVKTLDPIAEQGRNVPRAYLFAARDEDGDGWLNVAVRVAEGSPDPNPFLNALWLFAGSTPPSAEDVAAGRATPRALAYSACGQDNVGSQPARTDVLLLRLHNGGAAPATLAPALAIDAEAAVAAAGDGRTVKIGPNTLLSCATGYEALDTTTTGARLRLASVTLAAGERRSLAFTVIRGRAQQPKVRSAAGAESLLRKAQAYWRKVDLPYGRIVTPDEGMQAALDSCVRNIYQAREIKDGLPAFQVGPTCYRGLWVVDGSFLMEAAGYLGRTDEARGGLRYLLSFQRPDGGFSLIDRFWKETGIVLWAVTRHARLTDDKAWLEGNWPQVEKAVAYIQKLRRMAADAPTAPNAGLMPAGFSDGGLADVCPEYTNVYWNLAGLRAAVQGARWLGRTEQADAWQREYDDFLSTFRRAAARDMRTDANGNRYLPIHMTGSPAASPQRAQWAFLQAVFPGEVFDRADPLVQGNMAMLEATEQEGLVFGTGWLPEGIWNYFGSFYAHAWLWQGRPDKAIDTLYAFANHASPLLCWREEQMPVGKGDAICGDMPHNWASAELIRLVRHCLALERGDELHLLEGLPREWTRPGMVTALRGVPTDFGTLTLEVAVRRDGKAADVRVELAAREKPRRVVLHLDGWSARQGTMDLPTGKTTVTLPLAAVDGK